MKVKPVPRGPAGATTPSAPEVAYPRIGLDPRARRGDLDTGSSRSTRPLPVWRSALLEVRLPALWRRRTSRAAVSGGRCHGSRRRLRHWRGARLGVRLGARGSSGSTSSPVRVWPVSARACWKRFASGAQASGKSDHALSRRQADLSFSKPGHDGRPVHSAEMDLDEPVATPMKLQKNSSLALYSVL